MTAPAKIIVSAAIGTSLAAVVFWLQTVRLGSLEAEASARGPAITAELKQSGSDPSGVQKTPPRSGDQAPEGLLLDRVGEKLAGFFRSEQFAAMHAQADEILLGRIALASGITDAEKESFRQYFKQMRGDRAKVLAERGLTGQQRRAAMDELDQRQEAWIQQQLGPERAEKRKAAEEAYKLADAEHRAGRAVSRIAQTVDLGAAQKDALYSKLLERALHPPPDTRDPAPGFALQAELKDEPPAPVIKEEARAILTPEQWAWYEQQANAAKESQASLQQSMQFMIPAAIESLKELVAEEEAAKGKK